MQNYNKFQRILHDLVLGSKFIKKSLYELEKKIFLKNNKNEINNSKHLFITGLPRSGTTILLNFFYNTNEFGSFTYSQMPFITSPNLFSKISSKVSNKKQERFHSDGIFFDLQSPESFDEIFFSTFSKEEISEEIYNFVRLILLCQNKNRYISKNNFNYDRIDLIANLFPYSNFIIPVREPSQQAFSLFNQHKNFLKLQKNDNFVRRYMSYLGHFEFGEDHKSWFKPQLFKNFDDPNYWLEQWIYFHENIYNKYNSHNRCFFLKYENLNNENYFERLFKLLDLEKIDNKIFKISKKKITCDFNNELLIQSQNLYNKINDKKYF